MQKFMMGVGAIVAGALSYSFAATQIAPPSTPTPQSALTLEPCHVKGVEELARCGTLMVPEDHANPGGKKISLNIAILPPSGGQPENEPLYFLAGGPGQAATEQGVLYDRLLRKARQGRDTVLVDQRGTGKSNPFTCTIPENPLATGGDVARACLQNISHAPQHYTSDAFIRDLELVRIALGHETLSLMGISYGTRAALLYAKAYEPRVRVMVLDSVAPPHIPIFGKADQFASTILERTITDCGEDPDCANAFPTLDQDFRALLSALDDEPVTLTIPDADDFTISLTGEFFLAGFRNALYTPPSTRLIPYIIDQAGKNNYAPWMALTDFGAQQIAGDISLGLMLSVQCAEEAPLLADEGPPATTMLFPDSNIRFWKDACAVWPAGKVSDDFNAPVRVNTPTLLISGALDPVTPPAMAEAAAQTLPNSIHLVAANAGHSVIGYGCARRLVGEFLEHGDPDRIDGECLGKISKPNFTTAAFGPKP